MMRWGYQIKIQQGAAMSRFSCFSARVLFFCLMIWRHKQLLELAEEFLASCK